MLWKLACVLLLAALCLIGVRYWLLKRQLRTWAQDLGGEDTGTTNHRLRTATADKDALALARGMNSQLERARQERAGHVEALRQTQRSMADISHDLRTPLTSIKGYLGLMAKPETSPEQQVEYLQTAAAKTERLERLVNMLFEHTRLETGEYPFALEKVDVNAVLSACLAGMYNSFTGAGVQPKVLLAAEPLPVFADPAALERVFENLLGNSLRHGAGEVSVATRRDNGRAVAELSNLAPNLTQGDIPRLFQRSYVPDSARSGESAGLGLAIVYQFVRGMGGDIGAALAGGRLTITIEWPLCN